MYEQIREDTLFIMLYGAAAIQSLTAFFYLLFRDGNAFIADVTSPVRLRRWTAALFASMFLSHVWYMPIFYLSSSEAYLLSNIVGAVLDFMTLIPLAIAVLLVMLQDRRRPLWPVFMMMVPMIIGFVVCGVSRSIDLLPVLYIYYLLMAIGIIVYMVRATRQYGHWLRDNYADLEHKELWQSFVLLGIMLFVFVIYAFESQAPLNKYVSQLNNIILVCLLLWRVETLSNLSIPVNEEKFSLSQNIGPLLKQYCEESQLYLQHDITLSGLAREIGINRLYLTQFFSSQGMNYNTYINDLRINHFMSLYREAIAAHRPVIAQQLAFESGYHSYSTFSGVFKRKTGQSVTAWMAMQKMKD